MGLIHDVYARLRHEYMAMTPESNPTKIAITMARGDDGKLGVFGNTMAAVTTDGLFGSKIIRVDETTGTMVARTVVFDRDGQIVANVDSEQLTRERCGLMAALAVDLFYGSLEAVACQSYGLVGSGQINLATARTLIELAGVTPRQITIKGSPRSPFKNIDLFPGACAWTSRARALARCNVVIEATTIRSRDEVLEWDDFLDEKSGWHPELFVAQDGGWQLGQSFRQMLPSFGDHLGQVNAHPVGDYDWPWDDGPVGILHDLRSPLFRQKVLPTGAVAYLSGIALADIVIATGLFGRQSLFPER